MLVIKYVYYLLAGIGTYHLYHMLIFMVIDIKCAKCYGSVYNITTRSIHKL